MNRIWVPFGALAIVAVALAVVGCSHNSSAPTEKTGAPQGGTAKPGAAKGGEHPHNKPGAHGGSIVALGEDSYHAEAVFEKGRKVRLYMLGKEETRVQQVEAQELAAFVTPEGSTEAVPMTFKPEPQPGDVGGTTSLFVATLPEELAGKKVQVTINNINVGGERFRIGFGNEAQAHGDAMPAKKATAEEQKLFLTPGGLYTAADIKANGDTIPAIKYRGIRPTHEAHPAPGQKICPVSRTASNPKFTWVIGGKTYEFCCIPCIEEFLTTAKEKPAEIKDPSEYVKK